jgi:hypothetical protein
MHCTSFVWRDHRGRYSGMYTVKGLINKFGYFLSKSQQAVSANIIPHSAVGIFSPKTAGTRHKQLGYTDKIQ